MHKLLIASLLLFLSWSSCKKKIDFNDPNFYSVSKIINSKNCKAKCNQTPACENQIVNIKATLDELNIFPNEHRFFILDENFEGDQKQIIEVKVLPKVALRIFDQIENRKSLKLELTGKLQSFDAPIDSKCLRLFNLILEKPENLNFK